MRKINTVRLEFQNTTSIHFEEILGLVKSPYINIRVNKLRSCCIYLETEREKGIKSVTNIKSNQQTNIITKATENGISFFANVWPSLSLFHISANISIIRKCYTVHWFIYLLFIKFLYHSSHLMWIGQFTNTNI